MDYGKPDRADHLAASYSLGTMRGHARKRFEKLLLAHPGLQLATRRWQERLTPLALGVPPQDPSNEVWRRIEQTLFKPKLAEAVPWWRSLGVWRGLSGASLACLVLVSAMWTQQQRQEQQGAPVLVMLNPTEGKPGESGAMLVASMNASRGAMALHVVRAPRLEPGKVMELWALGEDGKPYSLGVLQGEDARLLLDKAKTAQWQGLAVSIEPPGGAPGAAPTGPIVAVGKLSV